MEAENRDVTKAHLENSCWHSGWKVKGTTPHTWSGYQFHSLSFSLASRSPVSICPTAVAPNLLLHPFASPETSSVGLAGALPLTKSLSASTTEVTCRAQWRNDSDKSWKDQMHLVPMFSKVGVHPSHRVAMPMAVGEDDGRICTYQLTWLQAQMYADSGRCQWRTMEFSSGVLRFWTWTRWRHLHRSCWTEQAVHYIVSSQQLSRVWFNATLLLQPFYGPLDFVWDYPGELVPER